MKKVPQIFVSLQPNLRGKVAQITIDRHVIQNDPEMQINLIANKYDQFLKCSKANKTVEYNFPSFAKRLSERQRPCEVRKQRKEDQLRKRDLHIVNNFCNWFMWSQAAYKPPVKK